MKKQSLPWICLILLSLQLTGLAFIFWKLTETIAGRLLLIVWYGWAVLWFGGLMVFTVLLFAGAKAKPGARDLSVLMILGFLTLFLCMVVYNRLC